MRVSGIAGGSAVSSNLQSSRQSLMSCKIVSDLSKDLGEQRTFLPEKVTFIFEILHLTSVWNFGKWKRI